MIPNFIPQVLVLMPMQDQNAVPGLSRIPQKAIRERTNIDRKLQQFDRGVDRMPQPNPITRQG
jgi:hypothetical protein